MPIVKGGEFPKGVGFPPPCMKPCHSIIHACTGLYTEILPGGGGGQIWGMYKRGGAKLI